jgi:hypothetical protein
MGAGKKVDFERDKKFIIRLSPDCNKEGLRAE